MTQIIIKKQKLSDHDPKKICDALAVWSGLPKLRIKKAMAAGAVWLQRPPGRLHRIRRASAATRAGDLLSLYYDDDIISRIPPEARCVKDFGRYSVWFKPPGLLTQGTRFGDHCSLFRQAELHFNPARVVFLVHRLDREALGLVLLTHDRKAAAGFSAMFQKQSIEKNYQIQVRGNLYAYRKQGTIDLPLDGRPARTDFSTVDFDERLNQSVVRVRLLTGRFHQIRRHFELLGFPVIGDPRYGQQNKNDQGMRLIAYRLAFTCPLSGRFTEVAIDPNGVL